MIGPKKEEGWVPLKAKQADTGRQQQQLPRRMAVKILSLKCN